MTKLGPNWHKSTRSSSNGDCVEARASHDVVQMRDSKDKSGPVLAFSADAWQSFIEDVKGGSI